MSSESTEKKVVVAASSGAPMPVTRLVSRPSVAIVDGRLAAVLLLLRPAA
jgi:hypothetical protein